MSKNNQQQNMREVTDTHGSSYVLGAEMSRGGQGIVYYTQLPQVLVKGFTDKNETRRNQWRKHIAWLIQQDLADLKIARPLALLAEPRAGYVMELMDGLISLENIFEEVINAADPSTANAAAISGMSSLVKRAIEIMPDSTNCVWSHSHHAHRPTQAIQCPRHDKRQDTSFAPHRRQGGTRIFWWSGHIRGNHVDA